MGNDEYEDLQAIIEYCPICDKETKHILGVCTKCADAPE